MDRVTLRKTAFAMPVTSPAFPPGPYRFVDREYFIIRYRTDPEALRRVVPEPLEIVEPVVNYEFIRMPDSTGFGDYTESGQVIAVRYQGQTGGYTHQMFLNDHPPIAGGRELWGFPKKLAQPTLAVETDTLVGTLDYGSVRIATGTMGYKHRTLDLAAEAKALSAPNFLLKIIPHVDGSPRICELVRFYLEDVTVKGAWTGPAALQLCPHALAPVAELPVLEVLSAKHLVADLTLGLGTVVHDYLTQSDAEELTTEPEWCNPPLRGGTKCLARQQARREGFAGHARSVLAVEHAGRPEERLRLHQGVLRDRLHRGPQPALLCPAYWYQPNKRRFLPGRRVMSDSRPPPHPASYGKKVGLVLQGGGALGSYQAGVYEALASSPYLPDWVAGISIGAINAALIAGNPPENRVAQLRHFWEAVTAPTAWWPAGSPGQLPPGNDRSADLPRSCLASPDFSRRARRVSGSRRPCRRATTARRRSRRRSNSSSTSTASTMPRASASAWGR